MATFELSIGKCAFLEDYIALPPMSCCCNLETFRLIYNHEDFKILEYVDFANMILSKTVEWGVVVHV